jgi:hypothetical protein
VPPETAWKHDRDLEESLLEEALIKPEAGWRWKIGRGFDRRQGHLLKQGSPVSSSNDTANESLKETHVLAKDGLRHMESSIFQFLLAEAALRAQI